MLQSLGTTLEHPLNLSVILNKGIPELLQRELEVSLRVVVGDILHDLTENVVILGELSVLYPVADEIAEDSAEILMSGVRQEASGVGQHADEAGEISQVGEGNHLILHTGLVIVEPPCASLLNLGNGGGILETAEDGADGLIVVGIQAVEDGSGKLVGLNQCVQKVCHLRGRSVVVDAVVTGVGPQFLEHQSVIVALTAIVQLHSPAPLVVFSAHEEHESGLEFHFILSAERDSVLSLQEDVLDLFLTCGIVHHILQRVVGDGTAHGHEEFHTLHESCLQRCKGDDLIHAAHGSQLGQIVQIIGLFDVHGLIGSPCGTYNYIEAVVLCDLFVPLQRINGVIGGADESHIALLDDVAHAHGRLLEFCIAEIPDFVGGLGVQYTVIAEISLQLQVAPVEERIADSFAEALSPFTEFVVIGGIAGYVLLVNTAGAHEAPLVVIAAQPYLSDVVELTVLCDLLGVDVAVVVKNRFFLCVVVEQLFGCLCLEQEVFVHKCFHLNSSV